MSEKRYVFNAELAVDAANEDEAYSKISDSGFVSGSLFGYVEVLVLDTIEEQIAEDE